jgi:hypothetical protein
MDGHISFNLCTPRIIHLEAVDLFLGSEGDAIGQAGVITLGK